MLGPDLQAVSKESKNVPLGGAAHGAHVDKRTFDAKAVVQDLLRYLHVPR